MHNLKDKSLDYLTALSDVRRAIALRRERDWSWYMIAQMLEGLGQLADAEIDLLTEDMASRLDRQKDLTHPPPGYGCTADGRFFKNPPELGTEADHPDYGKEKEGPIADIGK